MSCIFCQIIKKQLPAAQVYEDSHVLAFLDINPINPGHTLVVPKIHCENLWDAPEEVLKDLASLLPKISKAVIEGVEAQGFNIGLNHGRAAGQIIFHLHFHIIPRFSGDGLLPWGHRKYQEEEIEQVAEKIRANFIKENSFKF